VADPSVSIRTAAHKHRAARSGYEVRLLPKLIVAGSSRAAKQ
jgi:hypothetical protein